VKKSGPDPIFLGCRKFGSDPDFPHLHFSFLKFFRHQI
jgi:hypothetical protein